MDDMFQTLAYRSISDPVNYVYIWFINFLSNVANLLFLTDTWYKIRIFVKGVLSCRCKDMPKAIEVDKEDERGHSYNRKGYLRRQLRFYFWKVVSQIAAMLFYMATAPVLRFGINHEYYVFSDDPITDRVGDDDETDSTNELSASDFRNSIIFVVCNLGSVILSLLAGAAVGWLKHKDLFIKLIKTHKTLLFRNRNYLGFVIAILCQNGLIAILIIQYHQKIWWAFTDA
eukprot:CAMPEP_0174259246 /NCGR_PEP_ID=MMETSP0439-20130205/8097_1 /TAXON_ID=0 /ORGANISM="Stereomyxa ramosa, Strain Chinc5" /LENGTH=228 /DNA_ID=CAMNT_0015343055 /DNA_START=424 /DNA_END=1110 /DNA_ORIENTATION=-